MGRSNAATARKILACAAIVAFMAMMLSRPDFYLASARKGFALYATSVLPALFPFYFCSLLLTSIGAAKSVAGLLGKPINMLYGTPKESAYILLLSMLSGYPVGASMTAELYDAGVITHREAKAISAFASTSGPIFMLGTVGSVIFNDIRVGVVVLVAHYTAALLNGFIFRISNLKSVSKRKKRSSLPAESHSEYSASLPKILSAEDHDSIMSRTIASSTLNMLYVGGYIVLCGMLADTLNLLNIDFLVERAFGFEASRPIMALLCGLIEMTRGCLASAECAYLPLAVSLCAAIISFGGLSITLQNYTFLNRCKMTFGQIILRKGCQAVIAAGIGFALGCAL